MNGGIGWRLNAAPRLMARLLTGPTGVLVLTTVGTLMARMVSSVILTRLLAPEVYGLTGIIGSIFFAIALLTDLGFQSYVVRHPQGDEHRFQDAIWTIHAARGLMLALVAVASAPVVALVLAKPEIALPLSVAAATFAIDGAASLSLITLLRSNRSRTLSLLELAVTLFQTAASICLAIWLRSVWAIVASMILASLFKTVMSYRIADRGRHRVVGDRAIAADFWGFSRLIMASGFLTLLIAQTDKFALARLLSLAQFGLYATATTLAAAPQSIAAAFLLRILYPIYAQTFRDAPERLSEVYYTAGRHMTRLYWFGGGMLIGGGPLIIKLLYDPRYLAAGTYLSLLAITTLLTFSNKVSAGLMLAIGNTRFMLTTNLQRLGWIVVVVPLAFWAFGPIGIPLGFGTMECPVYLYSALILRRERIYRLRRELGYFALAALGGLVAVLLSELVTRYLPQVQ